MKHYFEDLWDQLPRALVAPDLALRRSFLKSAAARWRCLPAERVAQRGPYSLAGGASAIAR